jgi:ankyrin repeat protein
LAANYSAVDAIQLLIDEHDYDVNILINQKSFMIELLDNCGYKDFSILQSIFAKRKELCINSGVKLPLNQAIYRGNPFII